METGKTEVGSGGGFSHGLGAAGTDGTKGNTGEAGLSFDRAAGKTHGLVTGGTGVLEVVIRNGKAVGAAGATKVLVGTETADAVLVAGGAKTRGTLENVTNEAGGENPPHGDDDGAGTADFCKIQGGGFLSKRNIWDREKGDSAAFGNSAMLGNWVAHFWESEKKKKKKKKRRRKKKNEHMQKKLGNEKKEKKTTTG